MQRMFQILFSLLMPHFQLVSAEGLGLVEEDVSIPQGEEAYPDGSLCSVGTPGQGSIPPCKALPLPQGFPSASEAVDAHPSSRLLPFAEMHLF